MNNRLLIGVGLGLIAFLAYRTLSRTKTVYVDTFDTALPNVIDMSSVA